VGPWWRGVSRSLAGIVLTAIGTAACDSLRLRHLIDHGPAVEEGRRSYLAACASCHGADGKGHGPTAPRPAVAPPDLTLLLERHGGRFPRDFVIAVIAGEERVGAHEERDMPVWSQRFGTSPAGAVASLYARRRIEQLADYLESIQEHPDPTPGAAP
jgi:mono/diheme cytochrome c family protein